MGERKLNKKEVAGMTGLDEHVIADYYYERVKMFRVDTLMKIATALELKSINELIELEHAPDDEDSYREATWLQKHLFHKDNAK